MQFRGRSTDERNFDVWRHRGQSPSVIECHNFPGGCDARLHLDFDPIGCDRKINPSKRSEICVCYVTELWEQLISNTCMCMWRSGTMSNGNTTNLRSHFVIEPRRSWSIFSLTTENWRRPERLSPHHSPAQTLPLCEFHFPRGAPL